MRLFRALLLCALCGSLFFVLVQSRSFPQAATGNPIQIENQNPGTTAWYPNNVANNGEIEGYASATSVNAGQQISFFVHSQDPQYTLTIYRLGYYQGLGGRQMTTPVTLNRVAQPIPTPDPTTGMVECQWTNPYVFTVPGTWVSGAYVALLTGTTSGLQREIIFVVRNDGRASDFMFQSSVTTYEAYNGWGGKSLYGYNSTNSTPAVKVSFNRPYDDSFGAGQFFSYELNTVAFMEKEGYDVVYSTDVDTHLGGAQILLHKGFLSVGHDEYWSYEMRQNVTAARDHHVNLAFLTANGCYWQIRFEPSPVTAAANRTIVAYKYSWQQDPDAQNSATYYLVTARWRDARYTYPGHPEDALIGVMYNEFEPVDSDILIGDTSNWVFANTPLVSGDTLPGLLGYEVDREYGDQPADTVLLTHSPYVFSDGSTQYGDMTVYTAASGAVVFATGTNQWADGLSNVSPWSASPSRVNPAAQQITRNVLAKFISNVAATPTPTATASAAPSPTRTATATPSATPTPAPAVQVPSSMSFPKLKVGTTSPPQNLPVKNVGTASLLISGVTVSGPFAATNPCTAPIAPGATCNIPVTFTPVAKGRAGGSLSLFDNAANSPQSVQLQGSGK